MKFTQKTDSEICKFLKHPFIVAYIICMFSLVFYLVTSFRALRIYDVHFRKMKFSMGSLWNDMDKGPYKYSELKPKEQHYTFKLPEVEADD